YQSGRIVPRRVEQCNKSGRDEMVVRTRCDREYAVAFAGELISLRNSCPTCGAENCARRAFQDAKCFRSVFNQRFGAFCRGIERNELADAKARCSDTP